MKYCSRISVSLALIFSLVITLFSKLVVCCDHYNDPACQKVDLTEGKYYSNKFVVETTDGGEETARKIAEDTGFSYVQPIAEFQNYYYFRKDEIADKHRMKQDNVLELLKSHGKVRKADQEYIFQSTLLEMKNMSSGGMVGRENARPPVEVEDLNPDTVELGKDFEKDSQHQNNNNFQQTHKDQPLPPLRKVWPEFKERTTYKNEI